MKRIIFALLLMATMPSFAQVRPFVGGAWGLSNFSNMPSSTGSPLAFRIGGGVMIPLNKVVRLSPELYLSSKTGEFDGYCGNEEINTGQLQTRLTYLELPVYAVFPIRLGDNVNLLLKTGIYGAYGLNGRTAFKFDESWSSTRFGGNIFKHGTDFDGAVTDNDNERIAYPAFRRFDCGLAESVGIELHHVLFEVAFLAGLNPLTNTSVTYDAYTSKPIGDHRPKTVTFYFSAAYKF
jgi:hypothetical protein